MVEAVISQSFISIERELGVSESLCCGIATAEDIVYVEALGKTLVLDAVDISGRRWYDRAEFISSSQYIMT